MSWHIENDPILPSFVGLSHGVRGILWCSWYLMVFVVLHWIRGVVLRWPNELTHWKWRYIAVFCWVGSWCSWYFALDSWCWMERVDPISWHVELKTTLYLWLLWKFAIRWSVCLRSGTAFQNLQCVVVCCSVLQCVEMCCSVLQRVAVCCNVLQCAADCCSVVQRAAACCSVLQCVAVCRSVLQCVPVCCRVLQRVVVYRSVLQCVAVCCSVLHCVETCCHVLQCVAVCCSVVQRVAVCCIVL